MDTNFSPLKTDIDPVFKANPKKLNNQNYIPDEPSSTSSEDPAPKNNPHPSIRTYRDDVAEAIRTSHLSSINIAMAENEKMHSKLASDMSSKEEGVGSERSKTKIILIVSLCLVLVGFIGVAITYVFQNQGAGPVAQTQTAQSLITTEYKDELNVNNVVKDRFVSALSSKLNDIQIPTNSMYNTFVTTGASTTKRLVTASEFVTLAGFRMPDMITRTLTNNFLVGMYSLGENSPFVIFKTSSFENTYAGMIAWEKYLEKDFTLLFKLNGTDVGAKFEDKVVVNKDTRILRDAEGKTTFLYAILDKDTIVITVNENAFKEIVSRLNKEKGLKR